MYDTERDEFRRITLGPGAHHYVLYGLLENHETYPWDAIIYERFMYQRRELTKGVSLNQDALEYIGIIKLVHQLAMSACRPSTLIEQTPAMAKNFWTDDKLKKLDLWSTVTHERDATRHMLYYLTFTLKDQKYLQMLKG